MRLDKGSQNSFKQLLIKLKKILRICNNNHEKNILTIKKKIDIVREHYNASKVETVAGKFGRSLLRRARGNFKPETSFQALAEK